MIQVGMKFDHPNAKTPTRSTLGSSGFDLYSTHGYQLLRGERYLFDTGIKLEIPAGYEGQVRPRSGLAIKGVTVLNAPGTIDSDYRGTVGVILIYLGKEPSFEIRQGDRIAQLVFQKVPRAELISIDDLTETKRGDGGFGSTGK